MLADEGYRPGSLAELWVGPEWTWGFRCALPPGWGSEWAFGVVVGGCMHGGPTLVRWASGASMELGASSAGEEAVFVLLVFFF